MWHTKQTHITHKSRAGPAASTPSWVLHVSLTPSLSFSTQQHHPKRSLVLPSQVKLHNKVAEWSAGWPLITQSLEGISGHWWHWTHRWGEGRGIEGVCILPEWDPGRPGWGTQGGRSRYTAGAETVPGEAWSAWPAGSWVRRSWWACWQRRWHQGADSRRPEPSWGEGERGGTQRGVRTSWTTWPCWTGGTTNLWRSLHWPS